MSNVVMGARGHPHRLNEYPQWWTPNELKTTNDSSFPTLGEDSHWFWTGVIGIKD